MAIFNKPDKQTDYSSNITTISAGTHFVGKIDSECELHIDGKVDAEINSTGVVRIGQSGVVKGNLRANSLIITGEFLGDAECQSIELSSGGSVKGDLRAVSLIIDAASSFQGESLRLEQEPASEEKTEVVSEEEESEFDKSRFPPLAEESI